MKKLNKREGTLLNRSKLKFPYIVRKLAVKLSAGSREQLVKPAKMLLACYLASSAFLSTTERTTPNSWEDTGERC